MSHTALKVPSVNEPPGWYEVTVRVAQDDGQQPDPAAFAVAANLAASSRNASVVSAHTAGEIICVAGVAAPDRTSAVAVALAVLAEALKAGIGSCHPAGERPVPAVVRWLEEHGPPELPRHGPGLYYSHGFAR